MVVATFHPLRVAEVEELTDDAVAVTFEVPDSLAEEFLFVPGQNLTLRRVVDGVEERRQYSISAPAGARPRVGVREIPDGEFSRWLVREVRPGDEIEVQTPGGRFCPDPSYLEGGHHLCIAAGSGITPMLSVAASVLANGGDVTLLYGNRTTGVGDVRRGARRPQEPLRTAAPAGARALAGAPGRRPVLRSARRRPAAPSPDDARPGRRASTTCGCAARTRCCWTRGRCSPSSACRRSACTSSSSTSTRRRPSCTAPTPSSRGRPARSPSPSTAAPRPRRCPGRRRSSTAAGRTRNDLPFACKGGVCGTCRALVRDGEVDMRRNYALDEDEVERGFVLTCQTHPVSDAVTVDYDA